LNVLSLTTGAILQSITITGQVVGTGDTNGSPDTTSGPNLIFWAQCHIQRAPITLANGNVYVAFASYDTAPYHGWVFGYDKTTLSPVGVFCTTPNGEGGGIWNGGITVDGSGNLYVATGNGDYDGTANYGDTLVKLSPTLSLLDWFTPSNQAELEAIDADVSAGIPMLIPGTTKIVIAGKDFNVYVVDTTCMGHLQGSSGCTLQTFVTSVAGFDGDSGSYGGMLMNNRLYLPTTNGFLYGFAFNGTTFNTTPMLSGQTYAWPGAAQISGSSNGSANGIVWIVSPDSESGETIATGTVRALDPVSLVEIWNSGTVAGDSLGNIAKFNAPTVANGRLYIGTVDGQVSVYGAVPRYTFQGKTAISGKITIH
jgi:hypothetical protein